MTNDEKIEAIDYLLASIQKGTTKLKKQVKLLNELDCPKELHKVTDIHNWLHIKRIEVLR